MPLLTFANEAEFRVKWILPFLSKLGYIHVTHNHGPSEQGKDFFFADYDRFDHRRFYAVQAKVGDIGVGRSLTDLLEQVKRSFTVRLRFHKEANDKGISSVYIMTTGTISAPAREHISEWCHREGCGENVYFLEGDALDRLDKQCGYRNDEELRAQLAGIVIDCLHNTKQFPAIISAAENLRPSFQRLRHNALDHILASPRLIDPELLELLLNSVGLFKLLNTSCDFLLFSTFKRKEGNFVSIKDMAMQAVESNQQLMDKVVAARKMLQERYSIQAEVVE